MGTRFGIVYGIIKQDVKQGVRYGDAAPLPHRGGRWGRIW